MTAPAPAAEQPPGAAQQAAELLALVEAQAAAREALTGQITELAQNAVQAFDGWYVDRRVQQWAAQVAGLTEPLLRALARDTDAYQARVLSLITGRRVRPVGAVDVASLRQGVSHAAVYARIASAYRWQQSQLDAAARSIVAAPDPKVPDLVTPVEAAATRAEVLAATDAQLAVRNQSQRVMADAHQRGLITGWRRVIHPELSKGGTCGLCVAASDRLYGAKEPMPLHTRCHCVPMPVREGRDPGSALNAADLNRLYSEAGSTSTADLKRTRYRITEHSELGPLLSEHGAPVRTARQARRDTKPAVPPRTPEQRAASLRRVRDQFTPALARAQELAGENPKKWGKFLAQIEGRIRDLDQQLAA